jgi:hypothetical protein
MTGTGIAFGLIVLIGGLIFAFGFFGPGPHGNPVLIGIGLFIFTVCAIFGMQPGFLASPDKD